MPVSTTSLLSLGISWLWQPNTPEDENGVFVLHSTLKPARGKSSVSSLSQVSLTEPGGKSVRDTCGAAGRLT